MPFDKNAIPHLKKRIEKDTLIIGDEENFLENYNFFKFPLKEIAKKAGNPQGINIVALGFLCNFFQINEEVVREVLKESFLKKGSEIVEKNIKSFNFGFEEGKKFSKEMDINVEIYRKDGKRYLWNGSQGVALGSLAGGLNFITTYPMSPSTEVFKILATLSKEMDIVPIQCEDEIAVANMAIGAWYAGGKAMVTTSGGGFALMCEAISLAGAMESPLVIHLAQRPGPATGLPTRTEQGDLNLALYSGHGEFPRAIFAPSTIESCFHLTQRAFYLADKYQIPVFVLTDQHLLDSFYPIEELKFEEVKNFIVETKRDYKRYKFTEDGVSPRGIPGFGEGLVSFDSHEHDEEGHITEEEDLRIRMVQKRNLKEKFIKKEAIEPSFYGSQDFKNLIITWGSTFLPVSEALKNLNLKDTALLNFEQVWPLNEKTKIFAERAKKIIFIEGNYTSQFEKIFYFETGKRGDKKLNKYSGAPFSIEEVEEFLMEAL